MSDGGVTESDRASSHEEGFPELADAAALVQRFVRGEACDVSLVVAACDAVRDAAQLRLEGDGSGLDRPSNSVRRLVREGGPPRCRCVPLPRVTGPCFMVKSSS
eukprot:m.130133 g.130133  ORF g.130133 m.130133 type:complete len:104 (-) comp9779_c0_seq4:14759-15070(-)